MRLLFIFIALLTYGSSLSQESDTISYTNIFSHISDYRNYNEVYLGNMGLAKYNLFTPFDDNNQRVRSLFPERSNSKTYTDVFYLIGSGQENYFNLEHNQKLGKNLFGKAHLLKTNSTGIYSFQQADLSDFNVELDYRPQDKRYNFNAQFDNYKRFNLINGGVDDSTFFSLLDSNNANVKTTFPINIPGFTGTEANFLDRKVLDINFYHTYSLSKTRNDTTGYFQLAQSFSYNRIKQQFFVLSNNDFFDDFNFDSITTNDSLRFERLSYTLGLDYLKGRMKLSGGIGQNYYEYQSYSPFTVHLESFVYGNIAYANSKLKLNSSVQYLINEELKYESHFIKNQLEYRDTSLEVFTRFEGELNYLTNLPELYYDRYLSNHYQWNRDNKLNTIVQASFKASNEKNRVSVGIDFESQSNAIYFDSASQIDQTSISVLGFSIEKEFKLTNWMYLSSHLHFQDLLTDKTIEVPNFVTFNKLYFRGRLIKKVLAFDAGINVLYYSSFTPRAYNPALDRFYVQDNQKVGNYPFIDVFAEFYLKNSFAFFATVTHVNSNLLTSVTGKNFLATTNYPSQDRAFKFGIKWRLFD